MAPSTVIAFTGFTVLALCNLKAYALCRFPENFYETKENWRIRSEDGSPTNNGYRLRYVTIKDSDMKIEDIVHRYPKKITNKTVVYRCEEEVKDAEMTYVISVRETGEETLHTCVQFVIRAFYVIQWRMAPMTKATVSPSFLCFDDGSGERMQLIDSPFMYIGDTMWKEKRERGLPYLACPLEGGYVVTGYHNGSGVEKCNSSIIPMMKVENECESGEGFTIKYPQQNDKAEQSCPYPYGETWDMYCTAHWTHGPWTFMVATEECAISTKRVCIRYPTNARGSITLDISMVGICDTSDSFEKSNYRYHMSLIKYPTKSLCNNQYPSCENIKAENAVKKCKDWNAAKNCPEACSACPNNVDIFTQNQATFPPYLIGHWLKDTNAQGQENVTIEPQFIDIPSLGKYRLLKEADCWTFTSIATVPATEYILLRYFDNGCSPRVTTMLFANQSDSVISFRVSYPNFARSELSSANATPPFMWALKDNSQDWCATKRYRLNKRNQIEIFRTSHFNWFTLVNPSPDAKTVSCPMQGHSFIINIPDGSSCSAYTKQTIHDAFQVTYTICSNSTQANIELPPPTEFKCLADYDDTFSRRFLITRVLESKKAFVKEGLICWVFSNKYKNNIYWMRASECDSSSDDYAYRGVRKELAKLESQLMTSDSLSLKLSLNTIMFGFLILSFIW